MNDQNHNQPNSNPISWPIFFLIVAILPVSTGLLIIASSVLNWRNHNLPSRIYLPAPIGDVRLQIGNEAISWQDAFFIIWLIFLCIVCIAGAALSRIAPTTKRRRIAAAYAIGSLVTMAVGYSPRYPDSTDVRAIPAMVVDYLSGQGNRIRNLMCTKSVSFRPK